MESPYVAIATKGAVDAAVITTLSEIFKLALALESTLEDWFEHPRDRPAAFL